MRLPLTLARLAAAAWVGTAALFVITAVREVRHPGFDAATKDTLALLRFPAYYACGFSLVSIALASTAAIPFSLGRRGLKLVAPAIRWSLACLAAALLLMIADYVMIYLPIVAMVTPPGHTKPAEFMSYHQRSMIANMVQVGLCALAAAMLSWTDANRREPQ